MLSITMSPTSGFPSASLTAFSMRVSCSSKLYGSEKRTFFATISNSSPQIWRRRSSDTPSVSMKITLRPDLTTFRESCRQTCVFPLPASPPGGKAPDPALESFRIEAPRASDVPWLEPPLLARDQVPEDDEGSDRGHPPD